MHIWEVKLKMLTRLKGNTSKNVKKPEQGNMKLRFAKRLQQRAWKHNEHGQISTKKKAESQRLFTTLGSQRIERLKSIT